jgi:hypothetical protein
MSKWKSENHGSFVPLYAKEILAPEADTEEMDVDNNEPPPPVDMEESDDEGDAMPGLVP